MHKVLSASVHGIAMVRGRHLQWVNGSLAQMLGYQQQELVGSHLRQLYPSEEAMSRPVNRSERISGTMGGQTSGSGSSRSVGPHLTVICISPPWTWRTTSTGISSN